MKNSNKNTASTKLNDLKKLELNKTEAKEVKGGLIVHDWFAD